jgi:hypothetical protein
MSTIIELKFLGRCSVTGYIGIERILRPTRILGHFTKSLPLDTRIGVNSKDPIDRRLDDHDFMSIPIFEQVANKQRRADDQQNSNDKNHNSPRMQEHGSWVD